MDLPFRSTITWSEEFFRSLKNGYIRHLDLSRFFRLGTATAKRLFRYLDKKFYRSYSFRIDLMKLCHEHLGMSRKLRYPSTLKQKITPALEELIEDGYLDSFDFQPSKTRRKAVILYVQKARSQETKTKEETSPAAYFYQQLHGRQHISRQVSVEEQERAEAFVEEYGDEAFNDFVDFMMRKKQQKWPDLATLTGALDAFLDPFLSQMEYTEEQEEKREEQDRERLIQAIVQNRCTKYLMPLAKKMKKQEPERFSEFEEYLESATSRTIVIPASTGKIIPVLHLS